MNLFNFFRQATPHRFERQIRPHLEKLHRYASRLTGQAADAEDLIQDFLLSLYAKNIDLDALDNPSTWLLKSLYHQFIDFMRKQSRNPSVPNPETMQDFLDSRPDTTAYAEQQLELTDLQRQIRTALGSLTPEQRALVVFHDMEGMTLPELEIILDAPLGTLKSRLHRARQTLRMQLFMEPFTESERVTG